MKNLLMLFIASVLVATSAHAQRRGGGGSGGHSLDFALGIATPSQDDVNSWIDNQNIAGTKNLGAGYEFIFNYEYRFGGSWMALLFRPSYLMQSASGGGVKADVSGMLFFPIFRMYPLENDFIKFFMQTGIGYGNYSLKLENTAGSGSYSGGAFGAIAGIGTQFCFVESHCMVVEGNFRYLPIPRLTGSGTQTGFSQSNGELELNNSDVAGTLSGIVGVIGYRMTF